MILLIIFAVVAVVGFVTTYILSKKYHLDLVPVITASIAGLSVCAAIVCAVLVVIVKIDYNRETAFINAREKYSAIMMTLKQDDQNVLLLAGEIAEYNAYVLNGRRAMRNPWICDFDFDFYEDLPLVEVGGYDREQ